MDLDRLPVKLDIEPGDQTSEHSKATISQFLGGSLFGSVLCGVTIWDLPESVAITALIVAGIITVIPTLHYIASRRAIKCDRLRAEAEIHKQQIARQAAVAGRDTARTT